MSRAVHHERRRRSRRRPFPLTRSSTAPDCSRSGRPAHRKRAGGEGGAPPPDEVTLCLGGTFRTRREFRATPGRRPPGWSDGEFCPPARSLLQRSQHSEIHRRRRRFLPARSLSLFPFPHPLVRHPDPAPACRLVRKLRRSVPRACGGATDGPLKRRQPLVSPPSARWHEPSRHSLARVRPNRRSVADHHYVGEGRTRHFPNCGEPRDVATCSP